MKGNAGGLILLLLLQGIKQLSKAHKHKKILRMNNLSTIFICFALCLCLETLGFHSSAARSLEGGGAVTYYHVCEERMFIFLPASVWD